VLKKGATRLERKQALASIARTLPSFDAASVRARMGLDS